ncbi:hypothetical protein B0J17DRAFT_631145 [Rhizoctonia solani]|nr:hypothetical protein B0J17DRAFT_631145 [Rhizoctonia solani]
MTLSTQNQGPILINCLENYSEPLNALIQLPRKMTIINLVRALVRVTIPNSTVEPTDRGTPSYLQPVNVLVVGPIGAGKSTIINRLTNDVATLSVGGGLGP